MTQRTETLATAFEQVSNRMLAEVERLNDTTWDVVPSGEARTAGQIAYHMAEVYHNIGGFIQLAVAGQPLPVLENIDGFNARQAAHYADADREGALEMLRHNSAAVATVLRSLSDAQLDTSMAFLGQTMTVGSLAQHGLVGHTEEHLASIRDAAASV